MKTSKLYWKIFLGFVAVLVVTEILVFGLFVGTVGRSVRERYFQFAEATMLVARSLVEQHLAAAGDGPPARAASLQESLTLLGNSYQARFWICSTDQSTVLAKSFEGDLPDPADHQPRGELARSGEVSLRNCRSAGLLAHISIPISLGPDTPAVLNAFIDQPKLEHPSFLFALGLLIIGVVVALLIIPVSRLITRRLDGLRDSALRIAAGDLDHRAKPKGKDEIAELGRAFNHMVSKVQEMVESGQELTANLSHELRSPLARMRVAQEMMRDALGSSGTGRMADHLDRIQEDIERLDHLIGRMLELSKIDLHQKAMNREQVDMAALTRDLLLSFAAPVRARGLELRTETAQDLPLISGDPDGLTSVLTNIIDNAVRYTPEHGGIFVRLSKQDPGVCLEVTNTQVRLNPGDLTAMFEPFSRLEGASASGYGLGLAIARRIVERHGGSIAAANTQAGLSITVSLPI